MKARDLLVRAVSWLPGVTSDLVELYETARDDAELARLQRIEDEARITTDPHDMSRWVREPEGRRERPRGGQP